MEGAILDEAEIGHFGQSIAESYAKLRRLGVSRSATRVELHGDPVASGFWKSFVETKPGRKWRWDA